MYLVIFYYFRKCICNKLLCSTGNIRQGLYVCLVCTQKVHRQTNFKEKIRQFCLVKYSPSLDMIRMYLLLKAITSNATCSNDKSFIWCIYFNQLHKNELHQKYLNELLKWSSNSYTLCHYQTLTAIKLMNRNQ